MGLFSLTMLRSDYSYQCIVNITPEELKRKFRWYYIIQTVAVDEQCLVTEIYYIHLFQKILMCFWRKFLLTSGSNFKKVLLLHFHLNSQHSISNEIDSLNAKLRLFPVRTDSTAKMRFHFFHSHFFVTQKTSTAKSFFWLCRLQKTSTAKNLFWLWHFLKTSTAKIFLAVETKSPPITVKFDGQ